MKRIFGFIILTLFGKAFSFMSQDSFRRNRELIKNGVEQEGTVIEN